METQQDKNVVTLTPQEQEIKIIQLKRQADFDLTPIGQQVKQFEATMRIARMYAMSNFIPDSYKYKNGQALDSNSVIANCTIALEMAARMKANPLMVMQNLYIVHGQPSFSSKFLIACINASKRFSALRYEFKGTEGADDYGCRVVAYESTDTKHKEPLAGDWITMGMAKSEGWMSKNGSKWLTMPNQMLRYRAAAFWQRTYCPEISMGLITSEEVSDSYVAYEDVSQDQRNNEKPHSIAGLASLAAVQSVTEVDSSLKENELPQEEAPASEAISQEEKPSLL